MTVENPFVVYSPEDITPENFKEMFVKEHTWINALETPKDFFIYGIRGSGKSMLLNYLELSHQLWYFNNNLIDFLGKDSIHKYLGIMIHATHEELNTPRYELLLKNNLCKEGFVKDLSMNDLVMVILYKIINTLIETQKMAEYINTIDSELVKEFCEKEIEDLDERHIHTLSLDKFTNTELLKEIAKIFLNERKIIKYYAIDKFQIKDSTYEGNYTSFEYLRNFIIEIKNLLSIKDSSFYILIDNADEIKKTMQQCIDVMISQRQHKDVCFKVAVKKGIYWDKGSIQWPHDYSYIDIDELYSYQYTIYYSRIEEIATKRLKMAGIDVAVEKFFTESSSENLLLQKIKDELKKDYDSKYFEELGNIPEEMRPKKSDYINNRVSKYAQAELFRRLKKTPKSYSGFTNIVHLSSGIIRQFLDICSNMFDEEVTKKGNKKISAISLDTQNEVIKKYADDFIDQLLEKYKVLEEEKNSEEAKQYKSLYALIETLGKYYRERLMNPELVEPRVFTFTLKDYNTDPEIEKILEIGVNENYFQRYWYSSKIGLGKYPGYAFNRRLCPRYGIDHTSFRGRIELNTNDLKTAIDTGKIPKPTFHAENKEYITLDRFG